MFLNICAAMEIKKRTNHICFTAFNICPFKDMNKPTNHDVSQNNALHLQPIRSLLTKQARFRCDISSKSLHGQCLAYIGVDSVLKIQVEYYKVTNMKQFF